MVTYEVTSSVTIDLTGAHWGYGGLGDRTDQQLSVYAIDDSGTLKYGVTYSSTLTEISGSDDQTSGSNVTTAERVLVNSALTGDSLAFHLGWFKADFDDTGGASEDLYSVQTGLGDLSLGQAPLHLSRVHVTDGNGHGSTNTRVRRYSTESDIQGPDITYADSSTLGATFTINTKGIYTVHMLDYQTNGAESIGITVNDTSDLSSDSPGGGITYVEGFRAGGVYDQARPSTVSFVGQFEAGDVLRARTDGQANVTGILSYFFVERIA
jgi:hypothetical protein